MKYTLILALSLASFCLAQAAPGNNPYQAINSHIDITGQPVREKRASYPNEDYYICYPRSVVYSYHGHPNYLESHRRSDVYARPSIPYYDFDARKDRADRERAAYTDSFGK